jgi:hypothetical protein
METKSRFEVMREFADKKEALMREKEALDAQLLQMRKIHKQHERTMVEKAEEIEEFAASIPEKKANIDMLIKATEASIDSLQGLNSGKH